MLKFNELIKKKNRLSYYKGYFLLCFVEFKFVVKLYNYFLSVYLSFVIKKMWNVELNFIKIIKN